MEIKSEIQKIDENAVKECYARWDDLAKPLHGLGRLEDSVAKIAGILKTAKVDISKRCLVVMCADNGVVAQGVTQTDSAVTAVVSANFVKGVTSVCAMARFNKADVIPVDIGIDCEMIEGIVNRKIMRGTNDISMGPAMTREDAIRAVQVGIDMVGELKAQGYKLIATGEMGIGNTTPSAAVASVLFDKDPEDVTGRGAGLDDSGLLKKINVIKNSIRINKPDKNDPLGVISKVGSLDIAGMTGLYLGGAIHGVPIIIDGLISGVAAALACAILPESKNFMLASHVSAETAGEMVLSHLNLSPLITAGMKLGEGTGAMAGLALIDMAICVYYNTATFSGVSIENYIHFR